MRFAIYFFALLSLVAYPKIVLPEDNLDKNFLDFPESSTKSRTKAFDATCRSFGGRPQQHMCEGLKPPPTNDSLARSLEDTREKYKNGWIQAKAEIKRREEAFKTKCPGRRKNDLSSDCIKNYENFESRSQKLKTTMSTALKRLEKLRGNSKYSEKMSILYKKKKSFLKDSRCRTRSSNWCRENVTKVHN